MLHRLQVGERLQDNVYEDLPPEVKRWCSKDEYLGASYTEFPDEDTAVLMVRLNHDNVLFRWQRFGANWEPTFVER